MTTSLHRCGTPLVVTHDAVGRPRARCPKCDRVSTRNVRPFDDRHVQSQRHLEVPTPPRSVRTLARDFAGVFVHSDVTGFVEYAPKKPVEINPALVREKDYSATHAVKSRAVSTAPVPNYQPRMCQLPLGCGEPFQPTSARAKWCPNCRPEVRRARGAKVVRA